MEQLLTRNEFRAAVFSRDGHRCVFCKKKADETPEKKLDAHHIIERRLFTQPTEQGGYFISNGATVCEEHHLLCEQTLISVEDVRIACGITTIRVPEYLYDDEIVDKWGNVILTNGMRSKGPLFFDESVQKVLRDAGVLHLFSDYVKYGRTLHVPWDQGIHSDDKVLPSTDIFKDKRVIVTEKMDGENTSIYTNYLHARSIDGRSHPSRNLLKSFAAQFQYDIPPGWRVCGENLYARHSIEYDSLPHHFLGFSVWTDRNLCLSWDETVEYFHLFGITSVPVLYDGIYDEQTIAKLWTDDMWNTSEGYVIRSADSFEYRDFKDSVAKFVRKNHVQTAKHNWQTQKIIPNGFST